MEANVKIEGIPELIEKLKKISVGLNSTEVDKMFLDGAKVIAADMKQRAPQGPTGNLKRSIIAKSLKKIGDNPRTALAGVDRKIAPHAHLVEFGAPGRIAKRGSYKGRYFGNMPAHPFIRPAVDANLGRIKGEIIQKLKNLIERIGTH